MREFVVPGVNPSSAALHVARTVVRRAERIITALAKQVPVREELRKYINRLSDACFAMARLEEARAKNQEIEELKDTVRQVVKTLGAMGKEEDSMDMSIEAEVGSIGGEEDGVIGRGECADPDECKAVADLGVDMLAAGIGNIHGKYPENWEGLSFETLDAIQQKTGIMPLVLHGGTGIPADMIKKAIDLGVSKINVNTECQLSFADATRKYIEAGKDLEGKGFDPRKLLAPGAEAIRATVKEKMELFGSVGKAFE